MKEKLSALIDGELRGEDLHAHLGRIKTDAELRRVWDTYHIIGDALRGHLNPDFSARVTARLIQEPTILAPRSAGVRHAAWVALSAAASLAAVAMVAWTALPGLRPQPQLAAGPAVAAPPSEAGLRLSAAEVENYLLAHQPYSHNSALQGLAPYARSVSDEREAGAK